MHEGSGSIVHTHTAESHSGWQMQAAHKDLAREAHVNVMELDQGSSALQQKELSLTVRRVCLHCRWCRVWLSRVHFKSR